MKRILAYIITFCLIVSLLPTSAFASGNVTISATKSEVSAGDTFDVSLAIPKNANMMAYSASFKVSFNSAVFEVDNFTAPTLGGKTVDISNVGDNFIYCQYTGTQGANTLDFSNGLTITATFRVKEDATLGSYDFIVDAENTFALNLDEEDYVTEYPLFTVPSGLKQSVAVVDGADSGEPTNPYEIYYTLNKADGTDGDKYHDYQIGDTVTAEVFLKNNTANAVILQAYDIYLDYAAGLKFKSSAMTGAFALINGSNEDKSGTAGAAVTHIEAVADTYGAIAANLRTVPANGALSLGTISFTFDSGVVYDTALKLGFKLAADTTNSANATGITNFSVGAAATGDKNAYYPMFGGNVLGAEVMTTYAVSYDANTTETVTGMPAAQTKEYNKPLALSANVPVRTGYTFDGWNTAADGKGTAYAAGAEYTANAAANLYAQWTQNTFTVKWYDVDGNVIETDNDVAYGSAPVFNGTNPDKGDTAEYDYTFIGWNTNQNATTALNLSQQQITANTNYYPIFTSAKQTYTVTWVNHDGSELEKDENVPYGTTPSYDSQTPTKPSTAEKVFAFDKWTPTVDTVTDNVTYTATFTEAARPYTVKFATEAYGVLTNAGDQTITYGSTITTYPTVTANNGYQFIGWYTAAGTKIDTASYTVSKDETLTAKYELIEYTITLNVNGGNALNESTITYKITETVTLPAATKTGSGFDGWKLETATGSWEAKTYSAGEYNNQYGTITLVAQWSENTYTISQGSVTGGTVTPSQNSANFGDEITLTNGPADGYAFVSYTVTDASGNAVTVTDNKFTMPASNVTVSATFNPINYTVTVGDISNGSVEASKTTNVHIGDVITLTPTANTGYKWVSYTVTDEFDNPVTVTDNKFTMPAGSVTVTATFEGINYTIEYNKNGGDGTMNATPAVYGTNVALSANVFTKTGYHFVGWATSAGGEKVYNDEAVVSTLTTTENGTVTLYAVWEANTNTAYVVNHYKQNVANNALQQTYTKADTDNLTGTSDAEVQPAVKNYEGFNAPAIKTVTIKADGTTVVDYYYIRNTYTVNLDANYDAGADSVITVIYGSTYVELPDLSRDGYAFAGWFTAAQDGTQVNKADSVGVVAENTTLYAHWTATPYTITFDLNGGAWDAGVAYADNKLPYNIESTDKLPTAINGLYTFVGWKPVATAGNWEATVYNANTAVTGMYGNVTLVAQWEFTLSHKVENYKYAYDTVEATGGYKLLLVTNNQVAGKEYKFNGVSMFFINDANYRVNEGDTNGVFYYLIPEEYVGDDNKLNADGIAKLTVGDADATNGRATIDYTNRDINNDGVVNIADANVVYQMVINGGGYYSDGEKNNGQLTIEQRLRADMDKAATTNTNEFRGSIADVNIIVNQINGVVAPNA